MRHTFALVAALLVAAQAQQAERKLYTSWPDYGGSPDSMRYSALKQIDRTNVARLQQAWFFPVPDRRGNFGFNPIVVDGVMYTLGPANAIVAIDAALGTTIWSHAVEGASPGGRGMNYWESKDRSDRRLIFGAGAFLHAIDARTGASIRTFGTDGRVNMREGPFRPLGGPSGTAGRIFENLFLTGSTTGEGYGSPPGDLRAFDVVTGKLVWTFHTIPHPGEFGHDTWPKDAWEWAGGANTWGEISVDENRGIAYFPLGSATHDSFGGDRKGANLFANCLLALDARTGKRLWHFQAVHHDIWDYDLTTAPKLLSVRDPAQPGRTIDVVAQPTKIGFLYVFDRVSGKPLWPIEERAVPKSDVPGEAAWPTQPFPSFPKPFARQSFGAGDLNPYLDEAERARLRVIVQNARIEGVFTPQTLERAIRYRRRASSAAELGRRRWRSDDRNAVRALVRSAGAPPAARAGGCRHGRRTAAAARPRGVYIPPLRKLSRPTGRHWHPVRIDRSIVIDLKALGRDKIRSTVRAGSGQMPAFNVAAVKRGSSRTC